MKDDLWDGPTDEFNVVELARLAALRHNPIEAQVELRLRRTLGHAEGCQCSCTLGRAVPGLTGGIGCRELRQIVERRKNAKKV